MVPCQWEPGLVGVCCESQPPSCVTAVTRPASPRAECIGTTSMLIHIIGGERCSDKVSLNVDVVLMRCPRGERIT